MNGSQLTPDEQRILERYRLLRAGGGLGNPVEDRFFFENFRDQGQPDPWAAEVVYDPKRHPKQELPPQDVARMNALKDLLAKQVFMSKRPSFIEPPYWSAPVMKTRGATVLNGATGTLLDWTIPDRHRLVMTAMGINKDRPELVDAGGVLFWFALDNANTQNVVPAFDFQTPAVVTRGQTAIIPGSIERPFNMLQAGCSFQIKGPHRLFFLAQNGSGATIVFRAFFAFYQYELMKAAEYVDADLQL